MSILVDYRCNRCLGYTEAWVPSPAPATKPCPACGGTAKRVWSAAGLLRGPAAVAGRPEAPQPAESLCAR